MRRRLASVILAPGAAAVAVMLTATTALAVPTTWTASPSGAYTSSLASTTAVFTDTTAGQSITCKTETDAGNINASARGDPAVVLTITSVLFSNCSDPLGDTGWTMTSSGTWNFNAYHYEGADGTGTTCANVGVTCGTITNVTIKASGAILGASCRFTVTGSIGTSSVPASASDDPVTYTNSSGDLFVPNTKALTVSGVSGCDGIINVGDSYELSGIFVLIPKPIIGGSPVG